MNGLEYRETVTSFGIFTAWKHYIKCRYLFCILIASYRHGETSKEVLWKIHVLSEVERGVLEHPKHPLWLRPWAFLALNLSVLLGEILPGTSCSGVRSAGV